MAGSSQQRLELEMQGIRLRVTGLTETLRKLSKAGADSENMRELMHSTGQIIVDGAAGAVPVRSGALKASLRAGKGKTKAVVRGGGARVPYAGVIHYGWPARNITGTGYLTKSLQANRARAIAHIEDGLADLLKKNGLI